MSQLPLIATVLFSGLMLLGAISDIRTRRIPNLLSVALAIAGVAAVWLLEGGETAGSAFLHLLIALVAGMILYALGMWGGGDAKFYAAAAAWFPITELPRLLLFVSLAGLLLLVVWFSAKRLGRRSSVRERKSELPYGVAIAAGGIAATVLQVA